MAVHYKFPISKEDIQSMHAGDSVLLSGVVYTARDAAHKRLTEMLNHGEALPFDAENAAIYYVGPSPAFDGLAVGSAGPTTSSRCDPYTPALLDCGVNVLIGKGKRSGAVKQALLEHGGVYLAAVGGAGAMLSRCIRSAELVAFEDLGTEAIRKLYIEDFPAVVIYDCHGNDYYEMARKTYLNSL